MSLPAVSSPLRQAWSAEQAAEAQMPATVKAWSLLRIFSAAETQPRATAQSPTETLSPAAMSQRKLVRSSMQNRKPAAAGATFEMKSPVAIQSAADPRKATTHRPASPEPRPSLSDQQRPKSEPQVCREVNGRTTRSSDTTSTRNNAQIQVCVSQTPANRKRERKRKRNIDTGRISADQWKVRQVVAKRNTAKRGQLPKIEWLVDWDGTNPGTGKPWPMSWEKEDDVSDDLKTAYEERAGDGTSRFVDEGEASSFETDTVELPSPRRKVRTTVGTSQ